MRKRSLCTLLLAGLCAACGAEPAADPAPSAPEESGYLIVMDEADGAAAQDTGAQPQGTSCGPFWNPCGILHNRTSRSLEVSRDSGSSLYCAARGPYAFVGAGRDSNQSPPGFKDTDCFRSRECRVFYRGLWHPPGDWVRIQTAVWIYSLGC